MAIINNTTTTNAGEDVGKKEPLYTVVGIQISATVMENIMEFLQKIKNRAAI
jgi:hypothetical protein